jgi:Mg2+/Co2+ transporter CorB
MNAEEGIVAGLGVVGGIIYFGIIILMIISLWKVFDKAGKPGWAAIIPIYNIIVLLQIIGKPLWWIVLFLIPFVNFIFGIWANNLLSKSFGKSEGFTVGLVLLPFIFLPILGFGSAKYQGPSAAEAQGHNDSLDAQ